MSSKGAKLAKDFERGAWRALRLCESIDLLRVGVVVGDTQVHLFGGNRREVALFLYD